MAFWLARKYSQMVQDKHANALGRIRDFRQPLPQTVHDGAEGVLLDEVKQLLFGLEVVVQAGE